MNQKLIDQIGQPEVVEGVYTFAPSIAEGCGALERVKKMSGLANPDPYTSQVYDHVNMVLMAMAGARPRAAPRSRTISARSRRAAARRSTMPSTA